MSHNPKLPRTTTNRIRESQLGNIDLFALGRVNATRISSIGPGLGSQGSSAGGVQAATANTLKTKGDTMIGAIAFYPETATMSNGQIDMGILGGNYSSRVIISPQSGSTDDLYAFSNPTFPGQLLFLQGVATNTITIKNTTSSGTAWMTSTGYVLEDVVANGGRLYVCKLAHTSSASDEPGVGANWEDNWHKSNIETIDGNDFSLADDDIVIFMYDTTDEAWQQVTIGKQGGGGGGSGGHTIQDEGSSLTQRTNLNFVGGGVTATDDSSNNATVITIPGAGGDVAPFMQPCTAQVSIPTSTTPNYFSFGMFAANSFSTTLADRQSIIAGSATLRSMSFRIGGTSHTTGSNLFTVMKNNDEISGATVTLVNGTVASEPTDYKISNIDTLFSPGDTITIKSVGVDSPDESLTLISFAADWLPATANRYFQTALLDDDFNTSATEYFGFGTVGSTTGFASNLNDRRVKLASAGTLKSFRVSCSGSAFGGGGTELVSVMKNGSQVAASELTVTGGGEFSIENLSETFSETDSIEFRAVPSGGPTGTVQLTSFSVEFESNTPGEYQTFGYVDDAFLISTTERTAFGAFQTSALSTGTRANIIPIETTLKTFRFTTIDANTSGSWTVKIRKDKTVLSPSHEVSVTAAGDYLIDAIDETYAAESNFDIQVESVGPPAGGTNPTLQGICAKWQSAVIESGTVSFPIRPPVLTTSSPSATHDIDLSLTTGHVDKITVDKDITLTFSNPPDTGFQQSFEVEFTNSSTSTARTITLPSSVRQLASITLPASTPAARGVYVFRTNDNGSNYDVVEVVSGTDGNSGATPWTQDIDADGFDLKDLSNLEFRISTGTPAGTVPSIYLDATGDMVQNVATGDKYFRTVNGQVIEQFQDTEWEIRTEISGGPTIKINNNDQSPTLGDDIGNIDFAGNDSALASFTYGNMRVIGEAIAAGSKEGEFEMRIMHSNALAPILNYTGSDGTFRFSSGVDVVRPNRDDGIAFGSASQSWADSYFANYLEIKEMTTPGNPPANSGRLYVADDGGTTTLYFRDSAGTETDLLTGGGATAALDNLASVAINTSLISDTDNTDDLGSASIKWRDLFLERNIRFGAGGQVRATEPTIWVDASGDMIHNVATGDQFFWTVNNTTEMTLDASTLQLNNVDLDVNSNDLMYAGSGNKLAVTGSTHVVTANSTEIFRYNDSTFRLNQSLDMQDNEIILDEMGTAPGGISNAAIIFAQDNGGKTELMVQFPTGTAIQLAIEA